MKKISLLLGTLGGGLAGYLFSNTQLRKELSKAKDAEEAAKLLGSHLQKDGKKLAKQVQEFVTSDDVQKNLSKAKRYAKKTFDDASKELKSAIKSGSKSLKARAKRAQAETTTGSKRMHTKVRKLS